MTTQKIRKPRGTIVTQTIAMPGDTNANGDIFGGWLLSQMDLSAGVTATQRAGGRCVTVAIDSMQFKKPVHVGDIVSCYTDICDEGSSSIKLMVEAWCVRQQSHLLEQVTQGIFTFVAIDDNGRPRPLP